MWGRMDRLVVGEVVGPFVFGVLLFTSLFFTGGEVVRLTEFLAQGVPPATVFRLFALTLPYLVSLTFPMAMLLAALLGFGRLSNDGEIVALVAGGTSFARIVAPLAAWALVVSLVGLWFTNTIVPGANRGRETIIRQARNDVGALGSVASFTLPLRSDGALTTLVHVEGGVDVAGQSLRDVLVVTWNRGTATGAVFAPRARWVVGTRNWQLSEDFEGASWAGANPYILKGSALDTRDNAVLRDGTLVGLGTPGELQALERPVKEVSTRALRERIRVLRAGAAEDRAREAEVEVAQRIALPWASFVFALVGAPLGVRPQRAGKGVGFGLAILIIFSYWIALQFVSYLGKAGVMDPAFALALPNLAGIAAATLLIRRVLR